MSVSERIIREGWGVYTSDERHVGEVRTEHDEYIHVHHGRLFGQDEYYFPSSAIGRVDEQAERVYLTLSEAELEGRDWSSPPRPGAASQQRVATAGTQSGQGTEWGGQQAAGMTGTTGATGEVETLDQREIVVPIVEERLDVSKRQVELGEVVIGREVVEREETIPVEVAHEEVRVERRAANREATPEDLRLATGEGLARLEGGQSVTVPIIEEIVEVRKRLMVREELVITKQRVTERHEVTERLRRVEPQVESTGRIEREVEGRADTTATGMAGTTGTVRTGGMSGDAAMSGNQGDDGEGRNPLERAADAVRDKVDDIRNR